MKKNMLFILLFGLSSTICFSQNNSLGKSDPDAKKILDEASNKIKAYAAIQASFTLKIEDAKGNPQGTKKGTVAMKGNKYRLNLTGQEIYCDGKKIWTYDRSSNEVTITKFDASDNAKVSPQKIFTNFYDKDFLYKLNGTQKIDGRTVQEIEMTPVNKEANFFKVYIYVDKATKMVTSSKMLDKSGSRYIYTINSLKGNAQLPDAGFVFDKSKYPGVEEVDLTQ